jgi:hypothetical protein
MANHDVKSVDVGALVIANDLLTGRTVYLTESGEWTERVDNAWQVPDDQSAERAMKYAKSAEDENLIVGAYLVATERSGRALHIREQLRVSGPSVNFAPAVDVENRVGFEPATLTQAIPSVNASVVKSSAVKSSAVKSSAVKSSAVNKSV